MSVIDSTGSEDLEIFRDLRRSETIFLLLNRLCASQKINTVYCWNWRKHRLYWDIVVKMPCLESIYPSRFVSFTDTFYHTHVFPSMDIVGSEFSYDVLTCYWFSSKLDLYFILIDLCSPFYHQLTISDIAGSHWFLHGAYFICVLLLCSKFVITYSMISFWWILLSV